MSSDNTPPDCLVLKIEEFDDETYEEITNIFVLYDQKLEKFILRGSYISKTVKCVPYSFMADNASDLADFISFAMDKMNKKSYILYNYDNLPETSDEITYEFLSNWESREYEISGYNGLRGNNKYLVKCLRMLRNIYNPF